MKMFEVIYTSEPTAARRRVYFHLVDATDGITAETGVTGTGYLSKNGAAPAATSGSLVEIDATNMPGRYYIELTAGEVDTIGTVVLRFKSAATAEMVAQATIVSYDPYAAASTVTQIADGLLDRTDGVETGLTVKGALRLLSAGGAGKASGLDTATAVYRNAVADTKARITATVDANGNRTAVTTDTT